jgi:hypothetical protein
MKMAEKEPTNPYDIMLEIDLERAEDLCPLNVNLDGKGGIMNRIDSSVLDNILASDIKFTIDENDLH